MLKFSILMAIIISTSGCAYFTPPKEQPVQRDYVGAIFGPKETNVFSLTPERRTIIVQTDSDERSPTFCAEPAADVAEGLASSIRALAEATAQVAPSKEYSASLEASKTLNTSIVSLFYRSQGVQIFRDGLFNLCQAFMNGLITNGEKYINQYNKIFDQAVILISMEIPSIQTIRTMELTQQAAQFAAQAKAAQQASEQAAAEARKSSENIKKEDRSASESKQKPTEGEEKEK